MSGTTRGHVATTPLQRATDALLEAHRNALTDDDAALITLIQKALLHVGRRLAQEAVEHGEVASLHGRR